MQLLRQKRPTRASFIAELPFALWAVFFLFLLPFIDMASVLLRYTFLVAAARDGVHAAARSKTFLADIPGTPSAVNAASQFASLTASAFSEVTVNRVQTRILETDFSSLQLKSYPYNQPLSSPADESINLYEIEVLLSGEINPLLRMESGFFPPVPGLTGAIPVEVNAREYCEYPNGLHE